jgi:hypothetical protein
MKTSAVIGCGLSLVIGVAIGILVEQRGLTKSKTKQESPSFAVVDAFKISPELTDAEIDAMVNTLCKTAIREHNSLGFIKGAERVGNSLFRHLSKYPAPVRQRNHKVITETTIEMLRSPYHDNVFCAQKFIMKHLESDWICTLARDYISRYSDIDYDAHHSHHLRYFLQGANEACAENITEVDGTKRYKPETSAYSDFAKYVLDNSESLTTRMSPNTKYEFHRFVESRKEQLARRKPDDSK